MLFYTVLSEKIEKSKRILELLYYIYYYILYIIIVIILELLHRKKVNMSVAYKSLILPESVLTFI